jgi:hypothetical protein
MTAGSWTVTHRPDTARSGFDGPRYRLTAIWTPDGATRATKVIHRDNLTAQEVEAFSPHACWAAGLRADTKAARELAEVGS